jgi:hypothetical protein
MVWPRILGKTGFGVLGNDWDATAGFDPAEAAILLFCSQATNFGKYDGAG